MIRRAHGKARLEPEDIPPAAGADVAGNPTLFDLMAPEEALKLLHELQVHQIELKAQSEELQQAHDALAASRSRYFNLYHLAPVGYCTVDHRGLVREANLTAAALFGLPLEKLIGERMDHFVFREDQDLFHLHRAALMKSEGSIACELRMVKHDGTEFWVHLETTAVAAREIHLVLSDITGRKQSEAALSASKSLQMAILNTIPAHIAVLDREGKILAVNEPWLKFARSNGDADVRRIGVGANYLEACWSACSKGDPINFKFKTGPALGLFDHIWYHTDHLTVAAGDLVLAFTDGLYEVENAQCQAFSELRLHEAVQRRAGQPMEKLVKDLSNEIQRFADGQAFSDDVCLVGIEIAHLTAGAA